ncbi:alpha/beta hydrolase [Streptomyces sp. CB01881]|uniref:alpha/beta hydrolase n=1 Tax=Streptomyces sp. CB01881 TaxID=2078691 RepID=UPI000CDCB848|nr:alpha/beta hydrolase [Streptomyces sp. CB01881]AUY48379.1 alpha/beta hydrolase [Streptomyces sp. CB01881]TYC76868.1 alpha/beta hydrolase [Streptomyces sp. CB01881]
MRKVVALLSAAAAVAAFGGASASAASDVPAPEDVGQGKLVWSSCNDAATPALQCAMLEVPVDYADPRGRKIKIKVNRLPATAPRDKQQGPILLNPGGPGSSGLWMPAFVSGKLPQDVASTYDWIGFDIRGTNASEPHVVCDAHYFDAERPDYQVSQGSSKAWLAKAAGYAANCAADWSWLLPHMTTVDSARDMDSIRRALGVRQISFYGGSWGTSLGSTYGQLFPSHVRRMVLDSIVGPTISWYDHNILQDKEHQRRFDAFAAWAAKADSVYHLGTDAASVKKAYDQVEAALRTDPVDAAPAPGKIGPAEFEDIFYGGGYNFLRWPRMATVLSAHVTQHDTRPLAIAYNRYAAPGGDDGAFPAYNAAQCNENAWPRDWEFWKKDQAKVNAVAPFYTYNNMWYNAACMFWPSQGNPAGRTKITGKGLPPVLLFQATEDAATPYEGGLAMHDALPGSKLVVQTGGSFHEILFHGNACLDDTFTAYLRDGSLPTGGGRIAKTCAPEADPDPVYVTPPPALTGKTATGAATDATPLAPTDPEAVRGALH